MPPRTSAIDAELLAALERAFEQHAAGDDRIDVTALQRALGLRSEFLARRILSAFDRNGDGSISRDEFLAGVRALVFGDEREKLAFAFRLHDQDGDGFLAREELDRMIAITLAESGVPERTSQPPATLASALVGATDRNRDGRIALDELVEAVRQRPELLAAMTHSEAIWLAPNEELLERFDERRPRRGAGALEGRGAMIAFVGLWVLANLAALAVALATGRAHATSQPAMEIGRALATCLELNAALIFVPMLRRFVTWIRTTWIGRIVPVDESVDFHKLLGHALFALGLAHGAAFVVAWSVGHGALGRFFSTRHGATGLLLASVFAVMWTLSLGFVRRSKRFELFYFSHRLYVVWLVLAVVHAPRILAFAGIPLLAFAFEQLRRAARRGPPTRVLSAWPLRSGVTRLEIKRPPGFAFSAGDYVFLRLPAVARHEWHPFTISSAPEHPTLTMHVRSLGNWSSALRRLVEQRRDAELVAFLDGPYGTPSAHLFRSRVAVMIGAGVGVTPFASVLESVMLRARGLAPDAPPMALEKLHFFWLNRDPYSFEWFRGLLSRLEENDTQGLFDIHLCLTGARTGAAALGLELARDAMHAAGRADLVTGLRTKTHLGEPDWDAMLGAIAEQHRPSKVDVFYCGPHGLAKKLGPICHRLGMSFHEERF